MHVCVLLCDIEISVTRGLFYHSEILYEQEDFPQRELSALLASKVVLI